MEHLKTKDDFEDDREILTEWSDEIAESGDQGDKEALEGLMAGSAEERQANAEMRKLAEEGLKKAHERIAADEQARLEDNIRE